MARDRKSQGFWEPEDFEDISSDSRRAPGRRPAPPPRERGNARPAGRPVRRQPEEWEVPRWDVPPRDRTRVRGREQPERRPRPRPDPEPRRRSKKPLSAGVRRLMMGITLLVMAGATALLAIFLLFKVSDIQITGDKIEGCTDQDVLDICGYELGDNLFFLSTRDKEERLKEQVPYIETAEILRHLPGTLEIRLTQAQAAACVESGGSWLYVSGRGKILESRSQPQQGVMQVLGLSLPQTSPGQDISLEKPDPPQDQGEGSQAGESAAGQAYEEDYRAYSAFAAYQTVAAKLEKSGTSQDFTRLDLTDISNIRLVYRDSVEFRLGLAVELEYKIDLGLSSVAKWQEENPGSQPQGVMDLSTADETKRAYFTAGEIGSQTASPTPSSGPAGSQAGDAPTPSPEPTTSPRDEGIPNTPYTGESSEEG